MTTIATLLSGGEGVGVGAMAAGLTHLWGIEIDDVIAGVARANGFNVITAAIQDVDPRTLEVPDVLHASPECMRASNAYNDPDAETFEDKECRLDLDVADCIIRYLEILRPKVFTLENVYGYRRFQSYQRIEHALARLDYFSDMQHLNAADFGVPQTRRRLILRAIRGGLVPLLPAPEPWNSWYKAIEDLIPELPESKFAPWQLARLPERLETAMFAQGGYDGKVVVSNAGMPAFTVTANSNQGGIRAFIVPGGNSSSFGIRYMDEPMRTIGDTKRVGNIPRAFIIGGQFGKPSNGSGEVRIPQVRIECEPAFTVTAVNKGDWRAWLEMGRVVKMTPRCLARFQSFPDSYQLPDNNTLAYRVIGNAVPPLMYEKLVRSLS